MPTYDYDCGRCGPFSESHPIAEFDRPQACPSCGAPTHTDQQGLCLSCRVPVPFLTTGWLVTTIVSHHPAYAMMRQHFEQEMQSNPQFLQGIPPGMMHLLPIDLPQGGFPGQPPWPTQ